MRADEDVAEFGGDVIRRDRSISQRQPIVAGFVFGRLPPVCEECRGGNRAASNSRVRKAGRLR
jgi:hypothetical protein